MSNGIRVYMDEELEKKVRKAASEEHISPAEFISMVVTKRLRNKVTGSDEPITFQESDTKTSECYIRLKGEDALMLRYKAEQLGLTPTSYVRLISYTKEFAVIDPNDDDDFREFCHEFSVLSRSFEAAVGYIKRGEGDVFKQDVELLKDYMNEISELQNKHLALAMANRDSIRRETLKKIRHQIKISKN